MLEKFLQLAHNRIGLPRNQPLHIPTQGMQHFRLTDKVRECYDNENEQGHEGQQGVVSNGTSQKESLVGAEALQRLKRESHRVLQRLRRLRCEDVHWPLSPEDSCQPLRTRSPAIRGRSP